MAFPGWFPRAESGGCPAVPRQRGPQRKYQNPPGQKSAGQRRTPSGGLVVLVAKQLAGSAVEEVESGARRAGHRLVFMLAPSLPVRPVLHLKIGSGANEYQIHSALIGASRHETMIWRKILPP